MPFYVMNTVVIIIFTATALLSTILYKEIKTKNGALRPGKKIGHWSLLALDQTSKNKKWVCRCKCGKVNSITEWNLKHNKSTQCQSCKMKEYWAKRKK